MTRAAAVLRMSGVSELSVAAAIRAEKIGLLRRVGRYRRVVLEPYWARVLEQVRAIPEITAKILRALPNAAVAQDSIRLGALNGLDFPTFRRLTIPFLYLSGCNIRRVSRRCG